MTLVIAWSGGPDSTYALKQALQGDDDVAAVHVSASTDALYTQATLRATFYLEPMLQQIRGFEVVRYAVVCHNGRTETTDEVTALTMCAALSFDEPEILWGRCADDHANGAWINQNSSLEKRQQKMLEGVVPDRAVHKDVSKAEMRRDLGPLWAVTWSCLYPSAALKPCGYCNKCKERHRAEVRARDEVAA